MLKQVLFILVVFTGLIQGRPWCSGTCGEEYVCDDPECLCDDNGNCYPPPDED